MLGYLDFIFLSYSGRIGRLAYWVSLFALGVIELAVFFVLLQLAHGHLEQLRVDPDMLDNDVLVHVVAPVMIISVLFLYPTYAITTKRWHDRGKSGWWSLITLVPVIGGLWAMIELGFLGGDDSINEYGMR